MEVIGNEQERIDKFINEFSDFDLDEAKAKYKINSQRLKTLHAYATGDLYRTDHDTTASDTFRTEYNNLKELEDKIARYEADKPFIDIAVRNHKQYMLKKHDYRT
jgi:hypothetical protein